MNGERLVASRVCPGCGVCERLRPDEPVWPVGWRCQACGYVIAHSADIAMLAPELADTVTGFDPVSFATIVDIEASNFWFVARRELIVGLAARFFPDAESFLEIGCGTGAVLQALKGARPWRRLAGSDLHPTGLAQARIRMPDGVEFVQMNALAIPARATFDLIGAFDVVEHVADDEGVLRSIHAALRPGGGTIISVPQHPWLWSRADDVAHHQRRYRRGELEAKLRRNGFEVLASFSYTAFLLPLLVMSRLAARIRPTARDLERESKPHPWVNAALLAVLRAEVRLTQAGLHWPAGGSRVVVARAA
jgi:SAM-dependent methyltransferase